MSTTVSIGTHELAKYSRHYDGTVVLPVPIDQAFAHLDDPRQLAGHMSESSWQMGGGRMTFELDAPQGQRIGSVIKLGGSVLGMELSVTEAVTESGPSYRKVWETIGAPRLLIIGAYRMGFELAPLSDQCQLRVFIDYSLPKSGFPRLLGHLLARWYAKWCTNQMLIDAQKRFSREPVMPHGPDSHDN